MAKLFKNKLVFNLTETGSTNTYIANLPYDTPEGSVAITQFQSQGRGFGKNIWESEPNKNLTFSILLKPTWLLANEQFYLLKAIALGVASFVSAKTDKVSIKWPNDIYVGDKKIAGILIENSIQRENIKQSIAGIGLNINQTSFGEYLPNPVSLSQLTKLTYDLQQCFDELFGFLEDQYDRLCQHDYTRINEDYLSKLYRFNQTAEFIADEERFTGRIIAVEPTGELRIGTNTGATRKFLFKEVEYVI